MVSAGRVLIMPKGDYSAEASYEMLDLVSYNGSSYIAKKSTTGNLPTNTTYWQLSAYGGSAANLAGNFATLETTDYASQDYAIDDFLVTKNSQFCKVTAAITEGDELVVGSEGNLETTTVGDMMQALADYADSLDANNMQLKGMTAITAQTDLDDMTTIGNYYKSATNFYVTNAPTGIASELTAIFRLTVENGSDTTNKYIQTLRTNDGKTYTRAYNGSAWSTWVEFASAASVALKQPKTLDTPITVAGVQQTTCEGALGALNSALANEVETRERFNVDNLIETTLSGSWTHNDTSFSVNPDKSITATIISTLSADENYPIVNMWSGFDISDHIGDRLIITGCNDSFRLLFVILDSSSQEIYNFMCPSNGYSFIVPSGSVKCRAIMSIKAGTTAGTSYTYYPRLSVAMTNQELTPIAQAVSNRNLLDNPWFTVNQRGFSTSVTGSNYGYDRWKGVYSYSANGVSMSESDYMIQDVETELKNMGDGKMMTTSILLSDGRMFTGSAVYHKDATTQYITSGSTGGVLSCSSGSFDNYAFSITASSAITIRAVKLELGSVSTLAMDTAPNYAEELLKCQRYFRKYIIKQSPAFINSSNAVIRLPYVLTEGMNGTTRTVTTNEHGGITIANNTGVYITLTSEDISSIGCDSDISNNSGAITIALSTTGKAKTESIKGTPVFIWNYTNPPIAYVSADI